MLICSFFSFSFIAFVLKSCVSTFYANAMQMQCNCIAFALHLHKYPVYQHPMQLHCICINILCNCIAFASTSYAIALHLHQHPMQPTIKGTVQIICTVGGQYLVLPSNDLDAFLGDLKSMPSLF